MATYDLEEQEQLDELKTWWKRFGGYVTGTLLVVAVAAAGWQLWGRYQASQSAQASALFGLLQKAATERDAKKVRDLTGELVEKFPRTVYAGLAALSSAKLQHESGDRNTARAQLEWAVDHLKDAELRDLARLRLAAVLVDLKALDEALATLEKSPAEPLAIRFLEVRGDVLVAQGKFGEARALYQSAIDKLDAAGGDESPERRVAKQVLQAKVDAAEAQQ